MEKILELRAQSKKNVDEARAILDLAVTEKRATTNEEMAQADKMFADAKQFRAMAKSLEEADVIDAEDNKPEERKIILPFGEQKSVRGSDEYHSAFFNNFIKTGSEKEVRALQVDNPAQAGYLVPEKTSMNLIQALDEDLFMRRLGTTDRLVKAVSLGVPTLDTDPDDAEWSGEITEASEDSSMAFEKREFKPHMLPKLIKISRNLIQNGINVENIVKARFKAMYGKVEENTFLNGHGVSQPLGVFHASNAGIGTARDVSTDNTATAFTADGLKNCKYHLGAQYRKNAQWAFHADAVKMLDKLKDGENRYIWQPSLSAGKPETLLGYPINESSYVPSTFTANLYVGILGDFSYYWIIDALDIAIQVLYEKYATTNQIGYIFRKQCDGMPVLANAFARVKLGA